MATKDEAVTRVRAVYAALPEVTETVDLQHVFKVAGRVVAYLLDDHHGDGKLAIWCKASPGEQAALVGSDAERYFVPPYVGHRGWIGVRLDVGMEDWQEVGELLVDSYRLTAPKRLIKALDG